MSEKLADNWEQNDDPLEGVWVWVGTMSRTGTGVFDDSSCDDNIDVVDA